MAAVSASLTNLWKVYSVVMVPKVVAREAYSEILHFLPNILIFFLMLFSCYIFKLTTKSYTSKYCTRNSYAANSSWFPVSILMQYFPTTSLSDAQLSDINYQSSEKTICHSNRVQDKLIRLGLPHNLRRPEEVKTGCALKTSWLTVAVGDMAPQ